MPLELRRHLGLVAVVRVAFVVEGEQVVLRYSASTGVSKKPRALPDTSPDGRK